MEEVKESTRTNLMIIVETGKTIAALKECFAPLGDF
jgi:hypothetical protein